MEEEEEPLRQLPQFKYTSLKFWGGLLVTFYLIFFILFLALNKFEVLGSLVAALLALFLMPSVFLWWIPIHTDITLGLVWALELTVIIWLKVKKDVLSKRTIKIVGLILLIILLAQFVGCAAIISQGGTGPLLS